HETSKNGDFTWCQARWLSNVSQSDRPLPIHLFLLPGDDLLMKRSVSLLVGVGILFLCPISGTRAQHTFTVNVAPVLKTYCVSCHGGAKPKAGLALDKLTPDFEKNADLWK